MPVVWDNFGGIPFAYGGALVGEEELGVQNSIAYGWGRKAHWRGAALPIRAEFLIRFASAQKRQARGICGRAEFLADCPARVGKRAEFLGERNA